MAPECPRCKSRNTVKNGGARALCKDCGGTFVAGREAFKERVEQRDQELAGELGRLKVENQRLRQENGDVTALKRLIHGVTEGRSSPPKWVAERLAAKDWHHGTPTLMLSDLHWAERVFPKQVNGVNEYGLAIAQDRLRRVGQNAVKLLKHTLTKARYPGIILILGGDIVSGNIHEELRETNEVPIMEAVLDAHDHLVALIRFLADEFGKVFVPCVVGNHGRIDQKKRCKNGVQDSYEWILYQVLARTFKADQRVSFQVSDAFDTSWRSHNVTYLLTHGDSFKGGSGISGPLVPWALGDARKRKQYDAIQQPYDVLCFGHFHTLRFLGSKIANGSLIGFSEFTLKFGFEFERPQQALWITHPEHGVTFTMGVFADASKGVTDPGWVTVPGQRKAA